MIFEITYLTKRTKSITSISIKRNELTLGRYDTADNHCANGDGIIKDHVNRSQSTGSMREIRSACRHNISNV